VEILLFRGGDEKRVSISIPRARFSAPALATRWDNDVAVVTVPAFNRATAEGLRRAIEDANRRGTQRMVLDLRGAIGGEITDAVPAASLFTGKGTVAKIVSRKLALPALESTGERLWKGRTVVLTDDATGGAAEVFAAAVHDRGEATTVGETTVGMAIVQRQVPTQSGGSLFMTVGRYVSPSGTPLGGKGLTPDDRVLVFPGETGAKDAILERGLEVVRGATPARRAA
jgi:carboxyl-terminal processing protease